MRPRNLSPRALRDIDTAVDDIATSVAGPVFADRFAVAVADAAEQIARRPLLGHRRVELLPPRFRFWAVKGFDYLLVYNAEHPDRLILRVVHMARDLAPLLAEFAETPDR
ncbi:MAG: type II toxin-antitoxin system RelE/ParE family toxin [Acetobacteraceae bacterium]